MVQLHYCSLVLILPKPMKITGVSRQTEESVGGRTDWLLYNTWTLGVPFLNTFSAPRNALMFNNELMADVHFIVGPMGESQKVPAHKVRTVLPSGSKAEKCLCTFKRPSNGKALFTFIFLSLK